MARLIWVTVGAVGGIYAYRRGERAVETVREQGVAGTAQLLLSTAVQTLAPSGAPGGTRNAAQTAGLRIGGLRIPLAQPPANAAGTSDQPAIMETGVVDISDAARPDTVRRRKAR